MSLINMLKINTIATTNGTSGQKIKAREASGRAIDSQNAPHLTASFTLEASVVFPIFTCLAVSILFFFHVISCQVSVGNALNYGVRTAASITTGEGSDHSFAEALALFEAKLSIPEDSSRQILGGRPGVVVTDASEGEDLALRATYIVRLPISFFGIKVIPVTQVERARKWTGWSGGAAAAGSDDVYVYLAENASVYHRSASCTHLKLSIKSGSGTQISNLRNSSGGKYRKCEKCKPADGLSVYYYSDYGDAYHSDINCSGLKRTVYTKLLSEVEGIYPPCSKCGGG